ncbi:hypothetical protein SAMN04490244_101503 [Tranquillimonas rosea]|uniref:Amine oxidase domain-containing protein n=1 Tax=Tranquillimonas rosea TaxID=641238 RepID=A0A1H9Q8F1_9RHOB|nr:FAD-dependent oxidoreductase [Tranquillimonas rosea]SER56682.1 hypothetical protein SAMN04490244_101503 [Tranquillimonas rosea]
MTETHDTIAVIGAGLAGLTAARRLADAGRTPVVFDKGRGLGGRLATRRTDHGPYDHGAPGIAVRNEDFAALVETLVQAGAAAWHDDGKGNDAVGLPGASGLCKPLAEGLTVHRGVRVGEVARAGVGWSLADGEGNALGRFDAVIVAIPAPQAAELVGAHLPDDAFERVDMAPCWTLLAAWEDEVTLPAPGGVFAQIVEQGSLPDRAPRPRRIAAHADAAWSAENLELDREAAAKALLAELDPATPPVHAAAHRWRYARTARALGQRCLATDDGTLLAGGDWALGPEAEHAWESGRAMADALLASLR